MKTSLSSLCVVAALASAPAFAANPAPAASGQAIVDAMAEQLRALRAEVEALRRETEANRAELARLRGQASAAPAMPAATPSDDVAAVAADDVAVDDLAAPDAGAAEAAPASVAAAPDASSGGNANAFNPAISLILNGSYSHHSLDPDVYSRSGFPLVGEGGPSPQGLSLGESELSMSANIDDKFYGQITLAVGSEDGQDEVGIEEAFIDATSLPAGFNLRLGRFYSNIGYLNSHHTHTDNFADRPLAYQAFLGNQYGDDGVQLRWLAPTPFYLEFGGEVFRGDRFPAAGAQNGGIGTRSLFAHLGGSVGSENEWLAGISMLRTKADGAEDGFSGKGRLYLADATWKWAPQGNFKDGGVTLRGEYFHEDRDGVYVDPEDPAITSLWNGQRRGAYLEAVYRFNRTWDIGYRYDHLWADDGGPFASPFDPERHTAELTWRNSEFSLFRLQLSRDRPNADDTDNAVTLQYQTSLGAHGAHKF